MSSIRRPKSASVPPGVWLLSVLGLGSGGVVGCGVGFSGGLYIAYACATSFGLYGALLGFALGATWRAPGWGVVGATAGATPMLLLLLTLYRSGEANGSNDLGNLGLWIGAGILVSIPAALGAISAALFGIVLKARARGPG
jgi:hypothetical protein